MAICISFVTLLSPFSLQMVPAYDGKHLLPRRRVAEMDKKCVVIDLDETLVHSSFKVRTLTRNT